MINRKTFNGKVLQNVADWGTYIGQELLLPPVMSIKPTSTYNSATGTADITVKIEYFQAGTSNHNLVVVITEDSVMGPQKDYSQTPETIDPYNHMDMLRMSVTTGTWGEQVKPSAINVGEQFTRTLSVTIPPNIHPEHCHVVAYVLDNVSKEVFQAAEVGVVSH